MPECDPATCQKSGKQRRLYNPRLCVTPSVKKFLYTRVIRLRM